MNEAVRPPDDVDLIALIVRLWKGRWWIIGAVVVATLLALLVSLRTPRVYESQAIAVVASPGEAAASPRLGQLSGLAALAGISFDSGSGIDETLAVIRSREFSERFINEHNLLPGLFPERWDEVNQRWKNGGTRAPTRAEAYQRFHREVRSVSQDSKTGLVSISIVWPDPEMAARLANDLVDNLNQEMRGRAIARTAASLKFLQEELSRTSEVETRQAINRLMESQINQRMYANVTEDFSLRLVDRALPPDADDPKRKGAFVMLLLGSVLGFIVGCIAVLAMHAIRDVRHRISYQP